MKTDYTVSRKIRVLLIHKNNEWVAQGLELDLTAFGATRGEAERMLAVAFAAEVATDLSVGRAPLSATPQAPPDVFAKWEKAHRTKRAKDAVPEAHVIATTQSHHAQMAA